MVLFDNKMRISQHAKRLVSPVWKKELQLLKTKVMISLHTGNSCNHIFANNFCLNAVIILLKEKKINGT